MADKSISLASLIVFIVAALIVGGVFAYMAFPKVVTKTITLEKEVPIEVVKEVIKEVQVNTDFKQVVIDALLSEIPKDKGLRMCEGVEFDAVDVGVKRVYDGFQVIENNDGDRSTTGVGLRLSYNSNKCFRPLTCSLDANSVLNCH